MGSGLPLEWLSQDSHALAGFKNQAQAEEAKML